MSPAITGRAKLAMSWTTVNFVPINAAWKGTRPMDHKPQAQTMATPAGTPAPIHMMPANSGMAE